jgi:hypothetical protein
MAGHSSIQIDGMMKPIKNVLLGVPLKYGLIGGCLVIGLILFLYLMDKNPLSNARYSDLFVLLVFILFAVREFRDVHNNKVLHFWQGLSVGVITALTIAVMSSICIVVICLADRELLPAFVSEKIEFVNQNKTSLIETIDERAYSDTIRGLKETTITDMALDDFLKKTLIGLILSIIISVIFRKKPL